MKKLIFAIAAMLCFSACNKELGPEYSTRPVVTDLLADTSNVQPDEPVDVMAYVNSQYPLAAVGIQYILNDDNTVVKEAAVVPGEGAYTLSYSGTIPGQPAGTKVKFAVVAMTKYYVPGGSTVKEYTVVTPATEPQDLE